MKKSSTFQGLGQIQGLFKTSAKIQGLFKTTAKIQGLSVLRRLLRFKDFSRLHERCVYVHKMAVLYAPTLTQITYETMFLFSCLSHQKLLSYEDGEDLDRLFNTTIRYA